MNKTILCVDDDPEIRMIIRASLPEELAFSEANTVALAKSMIERAEFDLILIDLNLNNESGFELIEFIKDREFSVVPKVMIITGSDKEHDEIRGHQLEVSEYIRKPIKPSIFKAIIEKHLMKIRQTPVIRMGPIIINPGKMQVKLYDSITGEEDILLTLKEFKLLMKFIDSPNHSFSREELFTDVWDACSEMQSRTIDMHVSALRKKLKNYGGALISVRGVGYMFDSAKLEVS